MKSFASRDVDWPVLSGASDTSPELLPRGSQQLLEKLLLRAQQLPESAAFQELAKASLDVLQTTLKLDRVALFVRSPNGRWMHGTVGTNEKGRLVDERGLRYLYGGSDALLQDELTSGLSAWRVLSEAPLVAHQGGRSKVIGKGWLAQTPLRSSAGLVGTLYNDQAFSGGPHDPETQTLIATFLALISDRLSRAQSRSVAESRPGLSPHVRGALELLSSDPSLSQGALAKRLEVSAQWLGRSFQKEFKSSLVDFRNELRLERFLRLINERESRGHVPHLRELALASGFGSYAQFHRVFTQTLGQSPKDYLAPARHA